MGKITTRKELRGAAIRQVFIDGGGHMSIEKLARRCDAASIWTEEEKAAMAIYQMLIEDCGGEENIPKDDLLAFLLKTLDGVVALN